MELSDALTRYLRNHRAKGHSDDTQAHYKATVGLYARWCDRTGIPATLASLKPARVEDWVCTMRDDGYASASLRTRVQGLKAFTVWLAENDYLPSDPLARYRMPRREAVTKPLLSLADVERLCKLVNRRTQSGARNFATMLFLYSTGVRASEFCALRESDLDFRSGTATIRRGKGGKFRVVPLGDKPARAIERYLNHRYRRPHPEGWAFLTDEGEKLGRNSLYAALTKLGRRAGLDTHPHLWRHSMAVQYLRNGGKVEVLQLLLGHHAITMTMEYAKLAGVDVLNAHDLVDPSRNLKIRV